MAEKKARKDCDREKSPIHTHAFEWIYKSPMYTWRDKLLIVRSSYDFYDEHYCWLNSDNTLDTDNLVSTDSPDTK